MDRNHLLGAAREALTRYGVKRATMSDIAKAAGVSRQTLYAHFPNKEDIIHASVEAMAEEVEVALDTGFSSLERLEDKIELYFERDILQAFDMVSSNPDADDFFSGFNQATWSTIAVATAKRQKQLSSVLTEAGASQADEIADFLVSSAYGLKKITSDRDHLVSRLEVLKWSVLSLINET